MSKKIVLYVVKVKDDGDIAAGGETKFRMLKFAEI